MNCMLDLKLPILILVLIGSSQGGQLVTIAGSGFDNMTTTTVCGESCVFVSNTVSQFVCKTPASTSKSEHIYLS